MSKQVIVVDSREKANGHIIDVFDMHADIMTLTSKLPFGDYSNFSKDARLVVERKNSICELCNCVGKEHERFSNEIKGAHKYGFHMVILVEEEGYQTLDDLKKWENPNKKRNPRALSGERIHKIIDNYIKWYGIEFRFTTKDNAGFDILDILKAVD